MISDIIELDQQVNQLLKRYSFQAWMELNLTVPQLKSLFFISSQRGTNSKKLAAALGVTPPNVTGIVDRLVEQGLLTRRENPEDRRILVLQVTDKGEAILSDLRERRASNMREILSRLSTKELSHLARGLSALVKAAQACGKESQNENEVEYCQGQDSDRELQRLPADR